MELDLIGAGACSMDASVGEREGGGDPRALEGTPVGAAGPVSLGRTMANVFDTCGDGPGGARGGGAPGIADAEGARGGDNADGTGEGTGGG
ncbi:MAG: hypothetical protein U5Q44_15840 [Dehalococcoidia bacterium]|nr:hypothetical protein [Dehalococcoidia bacterium]